MDLSPQLTRLRRFERFMQSVSDYAIFFTDVEGGIQQWSAGAETLLGYTEAEALQMNGRVIFTAEDRGRGAPEREMETAATEGQANDERWHVRKDGSRFFAVGRLIALRDETGKLMGFAKIIRDATPHRTLQEALRVSNEQFRATFSQAPIGMVMTDLLGRIQQVNATFCQLTGYQDRELEGRELLLLTAEEDRPAAQRALEEMLAGNRSHASLEKRILRKSEGPIWVQNSAAVLRDAESRPLCLIDLVQDISVLKISELELGRLVDLRTSALQEKTRQMEAFCYTVAHDLRAPLRAIAGYAEILRQEFSAPLGSDGLGYVARIDASSARMDRLITDLLGYTRIQQVPVASVDVDLTTLLRTVVDQVKSDPDGRDARISIEAPLGSVRADPVTLEHVFLNLISNAVKFRRGSVVPEIRIHSARHSGTVRVWVEDNGPGVDPRFAERIFGLFERLQPDPRKPGTGVGLAIVSTAMERLGGRRGVEPNQPHGSRFWIELPA